MGSSIKTPSFLTSDSMPSVQSCCCLSSRGHWTVHVCPLSGSGGRAVYVSSSSSLLHASPLHCGSASGQGVCSSQAFCSDGIPQENHVSFLHGTLTALVCLWKGRLAVQFSDQQREKTTENKPGAKQSPLWGTHRCQPPPRQA